jgi:hypothetical protein
VPPQDDLRYRSDGDGRASLQPHSLDLSRPNVHELFYFFCHSFAGFAAITQIADKAWITDRQPPEFGPGHPGFGQEFFDLS